MAFPDEGQQSKSPRRRASDIASRKVRTRAMLFMVLALLAGVAAAGLIYQVLKQREADQRKTRMVRVLVAKSDLPIASTLGPENVGTMEWPEESRPARSFTDLKQVEGRVTNGILAQGDLITETRLSAKGSGEGIASLLSPNMRIMAVKVNEVSGVNGFLHPNDHVDVVVTMTQQTQKVGTQEPQDVLRSKIVLQNITVKAVGKEIVTQNAKPVDVTVVLLEVTPEDSERLALASTHGELQLTMRSGTDKQIVETPGVTPIELMGPAPSPLLVAQVLPGPQITAGIAGGHGPRGGGRKGSKVAPPPPPQANKPPDIIEILRGDRIEERKLRAKEQN